MYVCVRDWDEGLTPGQARLIPSAVRITGIVGLFFQPTLPPTEVGYTTVRPS